MEPAIPRTIHLVTEDIELVARFGARVVSELTVRTVGLRDAGAPAPDGHSPLILIDVRAGIKPTAILRLRDAHPRSIVVAIVAAGMDPSALYAIGVAAVVWPDVAAIAACCKTLLATAAS